MPLRKYEVERKLGEINIEIKQRAEELEVKKAIVNRIRMAIQDTDKEKQIRKLEEEAQKAETELMEVQRLLQQTEIKLNQLKSEQDQIVYPTCPNCKKRGNIFVFQAVATETTIKEHQLSEKLLTVGTGIIYCIKCGHIIGTANREKMK